MIGKANVVIMGGGVMGTSNAYHLAKLGCKDVVLVERDQLASGSTALSAGGIRLQFSLEANIRISMESLRTFEHFAEEFETEIDFQQHGYLFLATEARDWAEFQANVSMQQRAGVPVHLLSPEEIRDMAPYLYLDDVLGGHILPSRWLRRSLQCGHGLRKAGEASGGEDLRRDGSSGHKGE